MWTVDDDISIVLALALVRQTYRRTRNMWKQRFRLKTFVSKINCVNKFQRVRIYVID